MLTVVYHKTLSGLMRLSPLADQTALLYVQHEPYVGFRTRAARSPSLKNSCEDYRIGHLQVIDRKNENELLSQIELTELVHLKISISLAFCFALVPIPFALTNIYF